MKKLSLVLCLLLIVTSLLCLIASAEENTDYGVNIAGTATGMSKKPETAWNVGVQYLIDGDRSTCTSATHGARYTEMTITFDRDIMFETLVFVTNSTGTLPTTGASYSSKSHFTFWFSAKLLDENGNTVVDVGQMVCGSERENEYGEIVVDLSKKLKPARSIYIAMDTQWDNSIGLWELEAYEHACRHTTLKETYKQETCMDYGSGLYECICGSTAEGVIPAKGYHTYKTVPVLTYKNGYQQKGDRRYYCETCDAFEGGELEPLFKFLGYSVNRAGTSICAGYIVDKELLKEYEEVNQTTINYGAICSIDGENTPLDTNGAVVSSSSTIKKSMKESSVPRFDVKMTTSSWEGIEDLKLVLCAYIHEKNAISYICNKDAPTEKTTYVTLNKILNKEAPTEQVHFFL